MRRRLVLTLTALVTLVGCTEGFDDGDGYHYCDDQLDWDSEWAQYETEVVYLVNQRRALGAICGGQSFAPAEPMTRNTQLRCAARLHSRDMAWQVFFDHTNPDGDSAWDRVDYSGYSGFASGENIAQGYVDADAVMDAWMDSPGHCANIMNPENSEIGVGYYPERYHWTQVFGRR